MNILLAEDDFSSRTILTALLRKNGHDCITVTNGLEALEALGKPDAPRLAILDWMMPEMDGLEACRRIRRMDRGFYTCVILQTAKSTLAEIKMGFEAGADDYLVKPVHLDQLLNRIQAATRIMAYEEQLAAQRRRLSEYAAEMEHLADARARQLVHADRMATLGLLSAGIAHEINNPVTFIDGNAMLMEMSLAALAKRPGDSDPAAPGNALPDMLPGFLDQCQSIRQGARRISSIVAGLKHYARQEPPTYEPFSLLATVTDALQLCNNALKRTVEVTVAGGETSPDVLGDRLQIEQVLINLIINAAQAMETRAPGRLRIDIAEQSGRASIAVEDNGPGIPVDVLDKVFNPFFTTKAVGQGTGLGLSISRGIVEEHGGALTASNVPASGARFTFTLPLSREATSHEDTGRWR